MNVDNIKDLFCLFMNHLTSLSCELARLAIYQPREFRSVRANCGQWILLAVKFAIIFITNCLLKKKQLNQRKYFFESKPSI